MVNAWEWYAHLYKYHLSLSSLGTERPEGTHKVDFDMACDQIAQSGLNSLNVSYYSKQLDSK